MDVVAAFLLDAAEKSKVFPNLSLFHLHNYSILAIMDQVLHSLVTTIDFQVRLEFSKLF